MKLIGRPFVAVEHGHTVWVQKARDANGKERRIRVPRDVASTRGAAAARAACRWIDDLVSRTVKPVHTVEALAERVLVLWRQDERLAPKTRADRATNLRLHLLPAFGAGPATDITLPALREWVRTQRTNGVSRSAVNNRLSTLATLLDDAAAEGLCECDGAIARHAAVRREMPAITTKKVETIPMHAFEALISAPTTPFVWALRYLLAALAGLEDGVIAGLRWQDIAIVAGVLVVQVRGAIAMLGPDGYASRGKTKNIHRGTEESPRMVPVHHVLGAYLEAWHAEGFWVWTGRTPTPNDLVLPSTKGKPWRPSSAEMLRKHLEAAGQTVPPSFGLHRLRGCFLATARNHSRLARDGPRHGTRVAVDEPVANDLQSLNDALACTVGVFDAADETLARMEEP